MAELSALAARIAVLEDEALIRRVAARYMRLCDEPLVDDSDAAFTDLFTQDVVWEGVGARASQEFGRVEGRDALLAWFGSLRAPGTRHFLLNVHFLTSESIEVDGDRATGRWTMFQTALLGDEAGELRMASLRIGFRRDGSTWRIAHFRTRSLCKAPIGVDAARLLAGGLA
ncbi:hypothetical protein Swit_4186 [Rhizorhabdus wittichii RW1]|uniref:SnoaL-like domain-containing protein n=1 Tax=Rhizorhabdus wittichii (strain DSM 6014 / CCUG 31198 / JCM 15750 / NBRC 105917 / EY 4224 / RW1) TaxID=392499 RepID=A0A9J9HEW0_RHIWR|nr:hypothetical protein Swit_4186 [Rhizorhabdus wittichii RW1]